jgi:probable HAF family extracellular repeat protein
LINGVSGDGSIVVGNGPGGASQWLSDGTPELLESPPEVARAAPYAANFDGSVIAGSATLATGERGLCRWVDGQMQYLGILFGSGGMFPPTAISADGSVIVGYAWSNDYPYHAFRWTQETGFQDLGVPPDGSSIESMALGVSADGRIVVGDYWGATGWEPFVWTQSMGMVDLREYLLSQDVSVDGSFPGGVQGRQGAVPGISPDGSAVVVNSSPGLNLSYSFLVRGLSLNCVNIATQPTAQLDCGSGTAGFSVAAAGDGALTYQWQWRTGPDQAWVDVSEGANANPLTGLFIFSVAGAQGTDLQVFDSQLRDATDVQADFRCVVTAPCGHVNSNPAALVIGYAPTITGQSNTQVACHSGWTYIWVVASGTPAPTYQWRLNGQPIDGATGSAHYISSVSAGDVGSYDCVVTNACGTVTSDAASLGLYDGPTITADPIPQTVCEGGEISFSVSASSGTPWANYYQWRLNGNPIGGLIWSSGTYTATAGIESAGSYDCVVTNVCGSSVTSNAAVLTVLPGPTITAQPTSRAVCPGGSFSFSVSSSDSPEPTYQWRFNGNPINGATASTYTSTAGAEAAGSYDCVLTIGTGCSATTSAAWLTVNCDAAHSLITNGDFSAGNTGFTSDYRYTDYNSTEGEYTISTTPGSFNGAYFNPANASPMLVVNGATAPGLRVWMQTVAVTPGVTYRLSLRGFTAVSGGPAILQFTINDIDVGSSLTLPQDPGTWATLEVRWTAAGDTAAVVINDLNTDRYPNDFYIDDITMAPACGSADFNGDGDLGTDADIEAFFACLGGSCCPACGSADFNGDGDLGTDADIEAFFRVLGGGSC